MNISLQCQNIARQVHEVEALLSIFGHDECSVSNGFHVLQEQICLYEAKSLNAKDAKEMHAHEKSIISTRESLTMFVKIHFDRENCIYDCRCDLPIQYPSQSPPQIHITSSILFKSVINECNAAILNHIGEIFVADSECIYEMLLWIGEWIAPYFENQEEETCPQMGKKEVTWMRAMMKFHHIKAKSKRKAILHWANDHSLTGVTKPGKPGYIYVEGPKETVNEYIAKVRGLNWQKMTLTETNEFQGKHVVFDEFREYLGANFVQDILPAFKENNLVDFFYNGTGIPNTS